MNVQRVLWTGPDWSDESIAFVQNQVTELLALKLGVAVSVPRATVVDVLNSQLQHYRPKTGDIFTRYTLPKGEDRDPLRSTIDIIAAAVEGDIQQDASNECFSIWNSVDGTHLGMRFHPQVRLNHRRPKLRFNARF